MRLRRVVHGDCQRAADAGYREQRVTSREIAVEQGSEGAIEMTFWRSMYSTPSWELNACRITSSVVKPSFSSVWPSGNSRLGCSARRG